MSNSVMDFIFGNKRKPETSPAAKQNPLEPTTRIRYETIPEILKPRVIKMVRDFVSLGNVQSVDQRDKAVLVDIACAEVDIVYRIFPAADLARLDDEIEELRQRKKDRFGDIERMEAFLAPRVRQLGPRPKREKAAEVSVAASVLLLAVGIALSMYPLFADIETESASLSFVYALTFGILGGILITWSILQLEGRSKQ